MGNCIYKCDEDDHNHLKNPDINQLLIIKVLCFVYSTAHNSTSSRLQLFCADRKTSDRYRLPLNKSFMMVKAMLTMIKSDNTDYLSYR